LTSDEAKERPEELGQPQGDGAASDGEAGLGSAPIAHTDSDAVGTDSVVADESVHESTEDAIADEGVTDVRGDGGAGEEIEDSPPGKDRGPIEELDAEGDEVKLDWYILKVQSNRENTICDALRRRVAVEGLEEYFDEIMVPTEDVAEFKNGKKRVVKRKLYPGYIVVHMAINDDTWFIVRETPGIGDFTGSQGKPSPMLSHEVERIVRSAQPEDDDEPIKTAIPFKMDDRVRIKEGTFENFEGDVEGIDEAHGRVTVTINIFGRPTPVELEHWQIESV
jgi:transcriptional antiterminator NusG